MTSKVTRDLDRAASEYIAAGITSRIAERDQKRAAEKLAAAQKHADEQRHRVAQTLAILNLAIDAAITSQEDDTPPWQD